MWAGIFTALLLAYATAVSYSELAKLYPGAGSSYLFAEQAFLSKTHAYRFARIAKFTIGSGAHLYYWVYPGAMVATIGIMIGYIVGQFAPNTINAGTPGPVFMAMVAIIFAFAVAYIAYGGVNGSTNVAIGINAIQIIALLFFSALAIAYRIGHPDGSTGQALDGTSKVLHYTFGGRHAGPSKRVFCHRAAWFQQRHAAGDHRDFSAGRLRVGDLARRRGQQPQAGHSARRVLVADHSGPVLLPDRVLCRQLLHEQRLQPQEFQAPRRRSANDGDHRQ